MGELNDGPEGTDASCSSNLCEHNNEENNSMRSNEELCPLPPNRKEFQHHLREYNEQIDRLAKMIDQIVGKSGIGSVMSELKTKKIPLRIRRDELKLELKRSKPIVTDLKNQLDAKNRLLSDVENDLVYKSEDRLNLRLRDLEETYNRKGFTSVRNEQALVKEIDKLRRNKIRLEKYYTLLEERKAIEARFRAVKSDQHELLKLIRQLSCELQSINQLLGRQYQEIRDIKNLLRGVMNLKRDLIEAYNASKETYLAWLKKNRTEKSKRGKYSGIDGACSLSYPFMNRHRSGVSEITHLQDDEEGEKLLFEPFHEQKLSCNRVINYLENLRSHMDESGSSASQTSQCNTPAGLPGPQPSNNFEEGDDSADECVSCMSVVKRNAASPIRAERNRSFFLLPFMSKGKKKFNKKSTKKPFMNICHPIEIIRLFNDLEVPLPESYVQINDTLSTVRNLLDFYKQQTNVVIWDECDYSRPFTESEYTADSAWNDSTDLSDGGSLGSNHLMSASDILSSEIAATSLVPSSSCSNELGQAVNNLCLDDEGIDSKGSTR